MTHHLTPGPPPHPGEPATLVSPLPPPGSVDRAADPRRVPLPVPQTRWVAVVVWPTVLLAPIWGLTWLVINWSLGHCPEWGDEPELSVDGQRLAMMVATLCWMSPSLIGYAVARRRGGPHHFQLQLAGALGLIGAVAAWRLGPVVLCIS